MFGNGSLELEANPQESDLQVLIPPKIDRIALVQFNPISGALDENTIRIIEEIEASKAQGAELIVLPEMAITGYCVADVLEYDQFVEENKLKLERIAASTVGTTAIVGFVDFDPEQRNEDGSLRKYNAAAVFSDGELVRVVHKQNLPNYRYFDDKRYFTEGNRSEPVVVEISGKPVRLGIAICEDIWDAHYDAKVVKELAQQGADMIVAINASPFAVGKYEQREQIIKDHIQQTGLPFIYLNTAGVADNGKNLIPFGGESTVHDKFGNLLAIAKPFEEETKIVDMASLQGQIISRETRSREQDLFEGASYSLRDYMHKCGFEKVIVPVSGGIDSALGLAIAVEAVGAENVIAYNLPTKHNSETTKGIAAELCHAFGVDYRVMPIQKIVDSSIETYEEFARPLTDKVAYENIQARVRGELMMLEANQVNKAMLISCGNKTEIALGYCTLYGDMAGGVSVIGDLNKMDVYKVSRYVNERYGRMMIPDETFKIKASAELSDGQVDPFDYSVVSPLVDELMARKSPREIIAAFAERALNPDHWEPDSEGRHVYQKYNIQSFSELAYDCFKKMMRSPYKRLQGAPVIALTESAFGFDRRETLINGWTAR